MLVNTNRSEMQTKTIVSVSEIHTAKYYQSLSCFTAENTVVVNIVPEILQKQSRLCD